MGERRIGVIINGATGRMGTTQHMANLLAIAAEGGLPLANGDRLIPELMLVGRDARRIEKLAAEHGGQRWTTKLEEAFAGSDRIFMDCAATGDRPGRVRRAITAGKHIFIEKPTAPTVDEAMELARLADRAGLRHGVIQDKLFLPGFAKLLAVSKSGFFGRILSVRIDAGSWIFDGSEQECQRPSWNYKKAEGGGMILDMMPHYFYMLEAMGGRPLDVVCSADTLVKKRWDEKGKPYNADADDSLMSISRLSGGAMAQIMSSWCVRVRTEDIIVMQVDGSDGSAVAGLNHCYTQRRENTPKGQWSLDVAEPLDFYRDWQKMPEVEPYKNAFRIQWELFLKHVVEGGDFPWNLRAGAQGVQFAEAAEASWKDRRWIDLPDLKS